MIVYAGLKNKKICFYFACLTMIFFAPLDSSNGESGKNKITFCLKSQHSMAHINTNSLDLAPKSSSVQRFYCKANRL